MKTEILEAMVEYLYRRTFSGGDREAVIDTLDFFAEKLSGHNYFDILF